MPTEQEGTKGTKNETAEKSNYHFKVFYCVSDNALMETFCFVDCKEHYWLSNNCGKVVLIDYCKSKKSENHITVLEKIPVKDEKSSQFWL
ncbi:hypothetical protein pdam_00006698 [Pocillopora damicornis]|uniref:Uncharacterized protein n=1 Tax=Pocillopora damicornis TaxID=46731 RepID=A0A3M6UWD4_POCDA|nr:hypothetical protein pdam_00006698 [Pocillopora damicornis]